MSSRDGVRYVNSWEFQSRTSHFQDCKFSISLSRWFSADMKYRNDTQSMRRYNVKRVLCGASLWVGYLGLGAGFLYLLFNPQAVTRLFSAGIIGRRITGILGWSSWRGLNVCFVICVIRSCYLAVVWEYICVGSRLSSHKLAIVQISDYLSVLSVVEFQHYLRMRGLRPGQSSKRRQSSTESLQLNSTIRWLFDCDSYVGGSYLDRQGDNSSSQCCNFRIPIISVVPVNFGVSSLIVAEYNTVLRSQFSGSTHFSTTSSLWPHLRLGQIYIPIWQYSLHSS